MLGAQVYDWMYRIWAPWDSDGVRKDLIDLLDSGQVDPTSHPRSLDLGCGTGANVVHLGDQGFEAWGVDFSEVAIRRAEERARTSGVEANFIVGDLTAASIPGLHGRFDFLTDFGTLDDLRGDARRAMAGTFTRLASPGAKFLEYCFYGETEELPRFSFKGTSRMSHIAPGELEDLFGDDWDIEDFAQYPDWKTASFLLTKR